MREDDAAPPSHPASPADISFRGQVNALGAQSKARGASGGHLNTTQNIMITNNYFTVVLISLPDEYKQKNLLSGSFVHILILSLLIHSERTVDSCFFYFPNSCSLLQPL